MVMQLVEGRGGPLICCDSLMSLNEVDPTIEGASSSIAHFCKETNQQLYQLIYFTTNSLSQ